MVGMEQVEYIKKYCDNKYSVWLEKSAAFPYTCEQLAYHDRHVWIDAERGIEIVDMDYICD